MMDLGMKMMLKNLGFDPEKIMTDFSNLVEGVKKTLNEINGRLEQIEKTQAENLKLTQELTAWKRMKMVQEMQQLNQPAPPQPAPAPPNHLQAQPPANQLQPPSQPNQQQPAPNT